MFLLFCTITYIFVFHIPEQNIIQGIPIPTRPKFDFCIVNIPNIVRKMKLKICVIVENKVKT